MTSKINDDRPYPSAIRACPFIEFSEGTLSGFVDSTLPAGIYSISVTVTDDLGASASATLSLQVVVPPLLLQPAEISLYEGEPFTLGLTATGGIGHSYQIALRGALPSNFWFQSGVLGGTATSSSHVIGFTLTDGQTTAERDLMVHVERFEFITAADLPGGCIGQPYSQQITTRGNPAVTTNHALLPGEYIPLGLTLSPGGVLSGTPLEYGVFSFTVQAVKAPAFIPILRTFTLDIKDVGDPDIPGGGTGGGTGGNTSTNAEMPTVSLKTQSFIFWNNWALTPPPNPPPENSSPEILTIIWSDGEIKSYEGNQPANYSPVYPTPGSPAYASASEQLRWSSVWETSTSRPTAFTLWNNWVPDFGPLPNELTYEALRVRLESDTPMPEDYTRYFILYKVAAAWNNNQLGDVNQTEPVVVSLKIKKGRKRSSMITLMPRMCEIPPTIQGPGYVHMQRGSFDSLLPIEVVDANMAAVSKLKVGKMSDTGVLTGTEASATLDVDKDPDRFFIRVPGGAVMGGISVKVSTTDNPDHSTTTPYDDNDTQIDLQPDGADAISKSMLLVSDDVDDDHPVDSIADDVTGDRTHKVQLGGNFKIGEIKIGTGAWHTLGAKVPVPVEKTVAIGVVILRNKAQASGGTPVIGETAVQNEMKEVKERYAQAGIKVIYAISTVDPPAGVDLSDGLTEFTTAGAATPEESALITGAGTASTDDIHVFYVNYLTNSFGEVFREAVFPAPLGENIIASAKYTPGGGLVSVHFNVAHELGHLLKNDGSHPTNTFQIMRNGGTSIANVVGASKRFTADETTKMKSSKHAK